VHSTKAPPRLMHQGYADGEPLQLHGYYTTSLQEGLRKGAHCASMTTLRKSEDWNDCLMRRVT